MRHILSNDTPNLGLMLRIVRGIVSKYCEQYFETFAMPILLVTTVHTEIR